MSNAVRDSFRLAKRSDSYDVICLICDTASKAWDFRSNALAVGYYHVVNEHYAAPLHKNAGWKEQ